MSEHYCEVRLRNSKRPGDDCEKPAAYILPHPRNKDGDPPQYYWLCTAHFDELQRAWKDADEMLVDGVNRCPLRGRTTDRPEGPCLGVE